MKQKVDFQELISKKCHSILQLYSYTNHKKNKKVVLWSRPGSNRGPSACKADVITTTLQDRVKARG